MMLSVEWLLVIGGFFCLIGSGQCAGRLKDSFKVANNLRKNVVRQSGESWQNSSPTSMPLTVLSNDVQKVYKGSSLLDALTLTAKLQFVIILC